MARRYLLGFDVGSSSVKASLTDVDNGEIVASAFYPDHEAPIMAVKAGWAEQDPQMWWDNAKLSLKKIMAECGAKGEDILAIGISYQMHGLVCVDKNQQVLRPSIIWCDSRAVPYGEKAFHDLARTSACVICLILQATLPLPNWRGLRRMSLSFSIRLIRLCSQVIIWR